MSSKYEELHNYSNLEEVKHKAFKIGIRSPVEISSRKDKKYMIKLKNGKFVHFGQMGYEDYTKHCDPIRRELFRKRNRRWFLSPIMSPAWLAYNLLW